MRSAISILLIIILVLLTPVLFLVTSLRFNVLTAQFIKQELARENVYALATSQIDTQIEKIDLDPQYPVTHDEIAALAHDVLAESWLQQNIEGLLDGAEGWLRAPAGTSLRLLVDLSQPKQRLTSGLDAFLSSKLAQLQPCDKRRPKEEQGICQFAGMTLPEVKEQLGRMGMNPDLIAKLIPDTLDLLNPDLSSLFGQPDPADANSAQAKASEITLGLNQFKERYQQVLSLHGLALMIYGLLIVFYLAINAPRGWRRLTRWGGVLLLSLGLFPLAMALASSPIIESLLLPKIRLDPTLPTELSSMVPALIWGTRSALFTSLLFVGASLVVLGLAGILGAHWIPKPASAKKR